MRASILLGTGADGNGNGFVDGGDFLVWQRSVGNTLPAPIAADDSAVLSTVMSSEPILESAESESVERVMARDVGFALLTTNNRPTVEPVHFGSEFVALSKVSTDNGVLQLLVFETVQDDLESLKIESRIHQEIFSEEQGLVDQLVNPEESLLRSLNSL